MSAGARLKQLGHNIRIAPSRAGAALLAAFPQWEASRAEARARAAQANYLAAAYENARPNLQRSNRSGPLMSETGTLTDADWAAIVSSSAETFRNSLIMSGLIRRGCDSVVGSGLSIMPDTGDGELNKDLQAEFDAFTAPGGGWEVTGQYSLGVGQRLVYTSVHRDGDVLQFKSDDGWQFFEAAQIGTPRGYDASKRQIEKGVELGPGRRPLYYWVAPYSKYGYVDPAQAYGLRADRCSLIHLPEWFSGSRGLPVFHNTLHRFDDLERYIEAELLGALAAACVTLEINSPHASARDALNASRPEDRKDTGPGQPRNIQFAPAQVVQTFTGEKLQIHSSNRPSNVFPDFLRINLRLLGFPLGLPLEMGLMDYNETNFAAAKMALVQALLTHMVVRDLMLHERMLRPIFLDWHANKRRTRIPSSTKRPTGYYVVEPFTPWLEELKESLARNAQLEGGWNTLTNICRVDMKRSIESLMDERVAEFVMAKEKANAAGIQDNWRDVLRGLQAEKSAANPDVFTRSAP